MWFSAIPCLMCIAVGIIVSFMTKYQDPKKLNPDLISPLLPKLFAFWPRKVREYFESGMGLGSEYVSFNCIEYRMFFAQLASTKNRITFFRVFFRLSLKPKILYTEFSPLGSWAEGRNAERTADYVPSRRCRDRQGQWQQSESRI